MLGKIIRSEKPIVFLDFELPDKLVASGTLKLSKTYCCISPHIIHFSLTCFVEDVLKLHNTNYAHLLYIWSKAYFSISQISQFCNPLKKSKLISYKYYKNVVSTSNKSKKTFVSVIQPLHLSTQCSYMHENILNFFKKTTPPYHPAYISNSVLVF